tara:strand:+ start:37081 stop:38433 length:1353 start_codon:yes stop_codon:yes gene_type:complete
LIRPLYICAFTALAACTAGGSEVAPTKHVGAVAPSPEPASVSLAKPWTDEVLAAETERYLTDAPFRRRVLEASLTNPKNVYALTRLSGYGLEGRGWEMLPEWIPTTTAIDDDYVAALRSGAPVALASDAKPLWDGTKPTTMSEWVTLGKKVFDEYPLRSEIFAEHALRSDERAERIGLRQDENGIWPGVVAFKTLDGGSEVGITCALCHVAFEDGVGIAGQARRDLDYGEMRLAYYRDTGAALAEDVRARMSRWGPGRADITQDEDEDPVAIVDLWGVRDHEYLTQSGTIHQVHPAALAIRQETQLLHANQERVRPPRELAWALALYVYSLTPPTKATEAPQTAETKRGHALFAEHCEHCHRDKNYGGLLVAAASVGTDPALANGSARGTSLYRPTPLTRVSAAAPYLHDGTVQSLESLLDAKRSVPGHLYGSELPKADRRALIAFMETL